MAGAFLAAEDSEVATSFPAKSLAINADKAGSLRLACSKASVGMKRQTDAVKLEPRLPDLLKSVWTMGGQGHGPGNVSPTAEFNLFVDAESAQIVLDSGLRPVFVGWDVSTDETFLGEPDMARLEKGSRTARFALRCNRGLIEHTRRDWGKIGFDLPDPVALLAALHPELVTRKYPAWCAVGCRAEETYGQLIIDRGNVTKRPPNAEIVLAIDPAAFKDRLFETLLR